MGRKISAWLQDRAELVIGELPPGESKRTGRFSSRLQTILDRYGAIVAVEREALAEYLTVADLEKLERAWGEGVPLFGGELPDVEGDAQLTGQVRKLSIGQRIALLEVLDARRRGKGAKGE